MSVSSYGRNTSSRTETDFFFSVIIYNLEIYLYKPDSNYGHETFHECEFLGFGLFVSLGIDIVKYVVFPFTYNLQFFQR